MKQITKADYALVTKLREAFKAAYMDYPKESLCNPASLELLRTTGKALADDLEENILAAKEYFDESQEGEIGQDYRAWIDRLQELAAEMRNAADSCNADLNVAERE